MCIADFLAIVGILTARLMLVASRASKCRPHQFRNERRVGEQFKEALASDRGESKLLFPSKEQTSRCG
jgi:hypothetical protein